MNSTDLNRTQYHCQKMRILLIGYNFSPEPTGIGKYSGEMMEWLAKKGNACTALTAYPYYPYWKVQEPYNSFRYLYKTERTSFKSGGSLTVCRCPMYVPNEPSGLKRVFLDLTFLLSAFLKMFHLLLSQKFDRIIVVAPSFQLGLLGVIYSKFSKAKFMYHVQDMQIEAAQDLGLIKSRKIINCLFRVEKFIFDRCDVISSISIAMINKIAQKSKREVLLFPNWVDTKIFHPLPLENRSDLKKEFGFKSTDTILLYSGAIGEKQGLDVIIKVAKQMAMNKNLKFVVCGTGPYKQKLQSFAKELKLLNVIFLPLQPIEKFNKFLNMADVHLVIQKSDAGDLVMPSKLTTILSVGGLALITANRGTSLQMLVEEHKIALVIESENQAGLYEGIKLAIETENCSITKNARAYAEANLSIESVMDSFEKNIRAC